MSKSLDNYLPKGEDTRPAQGNVPITLYAVIDGYRKAKGLTWSELITALFRRLADEIKKKPA